MITRSKPPKSIMTVDEAVEADRKYFAENPDEEEYIREFVPGEVRQSRAAKDPGRLSLRHTRLTAVSGGRTGWALSAANDSL
jgi:hypothetical protein